jgi:F1F0 ATPase subunit 2
MTLLKLLVCSAGGFLLGMIFYEGLRRTVRRIVTTRNPAVILFTSFLARFGIVAVGMFFLLRQGLGCMAVGFVGFLMARLLITYAGGWRRTDGPLS